MLRGFSRPSISQLCMQQEPKGPRKRSSRKRYGSQLPGLTGRPLGKAKRKLLERLDNEEEELDTVRDELKKRLAEERDTSTAWTKTKEFLDIQQRWSKEFNSPSKDTDEDDIVGNTNVFEWKQVKDPESGDVYFWNINTDETTWDVPEGVEVLGDLTPFRGLTMTIADPAGTEGVKWICTQKTTGHAHNGIFFEVQAKSADVYITGVRTGSHEHSDIYVTKYRVFVRDGPSYGHEMSKSGWKQVGMKNVKALVKRVGPKKWDAFGFPRQVKRTVEGVNKLLPSISDLDENPELFYGPLPLTEAIRVPAGQTVSIAIWCEDMLGIILRKKDPWMNNGRRRTRRYVGGFFDKGEVTDENVDMTLRSGLVPTEAIFSKVLNPEGYMGFVGVLEYVLDKNFVPEFPSPENLEGEDLEDEELTQDGTANTSEEASPEALNEDLLGDEEEEEQEELDEEAIKALNEGPQHLFFGGDKEGSQKSGAEGQVELFLGCFLNDKDLGELAIDASTDWEELKTELEDLVGSPASFTYQRPDSDKTVKVNDEKSWAACKDLLTDPQMDLEGYIEIDIIKQ
uniref:WW domain-containing protein n=1 Tax=Guillardia theta TaxID=55529 RepID=A0A7S4K7J3_GUITH